jgi:hypothetical protein
VLSLTNILGAWPHPTYPRCQVNGVNQVEPWRRAAARDLSVVRLGLLAECECDHCYADTMATGAAAFPAETDVGGYIGVGDSASSVMSIHTLDKRYLSVGVNTLHHYTVFNAV